MVTPFDLPQSTGNASESRRLVPIPQLSPELEDADQCSVEAVVTLVWPYSSLNKSFCLLLADPDFRQRQKNGQVRVSFRGLCAEEVVRSKGSIGDKVTLSLQGVTWVENEQTQHTPGKSVGWELQFTNSVDLRVRDSSFMKD